MELKVLDGGRGVRGGLSGCRGRTWVYAWWSNGEGKTRRRGAGVGLRLPALPGDGWRQIGLDPNRKLPSLTTGVGSRGRSRGSGVVSPENQYFLQTFSVSVVFDKLQLIVMFFL